jgi:tetratricopeptide (TPR) repeat protein
VGDWRNLAFTLSILGYRVLSSGEIESAQKLLDESLALYRRMNDRNGMEFVLTAKSQMALMNGEYEQARTFLQEWVVLAEEMGNRMGRLWARARLGYVTLREGNVAEAQRILVEALEAFQKDRNKSGLAFVFDKLASLYVAIDKAEYAAHLIGWSDTTRKEIGDPRPRLEQVDVDRDIETIREKIGSATFEVACNSGRKMALDEVIAFVLDGS